jgi:hypothetical protein
MRSDDKREFRKLKGQVKQAGNRKRRRALQRDLRDNPGEAANSEITFGRNSSVNLNGNDRDATRRRPKASEPEA